jgi:hypothetical protein
MKANIQYIRRILLPVMGVSVFVVSVAQSGPTNTVASTNKAKGSTSTTAKTVAAQTNKWEIAQSVFVMPNAPAAGKDPFYPRSPYPYQGNNPPPITRTNPGPIIASLPDLILSGLSGTEEKPLAIVNYVTFGVGDERDVPTGTGRKVHVHCVEIRLAEKTAVVSIGGRLQTLRLEEKPKK